MFDVSFGEYVISVHDGGLPELYASFLRNAEFNLEKNLNRPEGKSAYCGVARGDAWPFCVIAFRYAPCEVGFKPGVLLIPETELLFVGGGELLLAVDLKKRRELWEDVADVGFWSWRRHDDVVLMSAELELTAWTIRGEKLWSTFVEPPWSYSAAAGLIELDVMGNVSEFPLQAGPPAA